MFDFANPMMHSPKRHETIVSQQFLWFMNGELATEFSREFVDPSMPRTDEETEPDIDARESDSIDSIKDDSSWQQDGFSLDSSGGFPGHDPERAVVRRWILAEDGTLEIKSSILERRGLLEDTLVVCSSEFRRTPTADANDVANGKEPGRDHNHRGFSLRMAGGGVRGGMAYTTTAGKLAPMFVALVRTSSSTLVKFAIRVIHSSTSSMTPREARKNGLREVRGTHFHTFRGRSRIVGQA